MHSMRGSYNHNVQVRMDETIELNERDTYKFPRYKNGKTLLGKLPSNLGSLNHD